MSDTQREIIYIADPMCSWCWGFAPVIEEIKRDYEGHALFRVVVGGLRIGTTQLMDQATKDMVLHHWHEVNKMTGQEFCFDFNFPDTFVYDTEPGCRAVVTVRELNPSEALAYFDALHHAFYAKNEDITNTQVLAGYAAQHGVDEKAFTETFATKDMRRKTLDDVAFAMNMGVRGFPAVMLKQDEDYRLLTIGYQPIEVLRPRLDSWVEAA